MNEVEKSLTHLVTWFWQMSMDDDVVCSGIQIGAQRRKDCDNESRESFGESLVHTCKLYDVCRYTELQEVDIRRYEMWHAAGCYDIYKYERIRKLEGTILNHVWHLLIISSVLYSSFYMDSQLLVEEDPMMDPINYKRSEDQTDRKDI